MREYHYVVDRDGRIFHDGTERIETSAAPKLTPDEVSALAAFEERDAMWREISKLPARQRACLVLRYYEDLPDGEIAGLLGCRIGTVKSQSSRALAKLRKEVSR